MSDANTQEEWFDQNAGGTGHPALKFDKVGDAIVGIILNTPKPVTRPSLKDGSPEKQLPVNMEVDGEPRTLWIGPIGFLIRAVHEAIEAGGAKKLAKGGKLGVKFIEEREVGKPNKAKVFAAKYEPPEHEEDETEATTAAVAGPGPSLDDIF